MAISARESGSSSRTEIRPASDSEAWFMSTNFCEPVSVVLGGIRLAREVQGDVAVLREEPRDER